MSVPINSQENNLHDDLFDPVSFEPLTDAVTLFPCGHVVSEETAALEECPLDRKPVEKFVANHTVRNVVIAMLGKPGEQKELKIISDDTVQLGKKIGGGSFGAVHEEEWVHNPVAVKLLLDAPNDKLKETVVMELMEQSLYDAIETGKTKNWPPHQRVQVIKGAASGLTYLHEQNIMHRDLKSMNLLLKGNTAKFTDFGVSKTKEHTAKTMTGMVGSPSWMAPEVLRGDTDYDKPADIYSLSLILWEIFHEKVPFENLNVPQTIEQVAFQNKKETISEETPAPLQDLMKQSWQEPASRPIAPAFLETLVTFQKTLPSIAPPENPPLPMSSAPPPTYKPEALQAPVPSGQAKR